MVNSITPSAGRPRGATTRPAEPVTATGSGRTTTAGIGSEALSGTLAGGAIGADPADGPGTGAGPSGRSTARTTRTGTTASKATGRTRTRRRTAPAGVTPSAGGRARPRTGGPAITLTGRGGIVAIFAVSLFGELIGELASLEAAPGIAFLIGCVLAALLTRPADVLILAASPPAVFLAAALISAFAGAIGTNSMILSVLVGVFGTLTAQAPWLFLGTALVIGLTIPRGLVAALTDLRTRLAGVRRLSDIYDDDPVRWNEPPAPRPQREHP